MRKLYILFLFALSALSCGKDATPDAEPTPSYLGQWKTISVRPSIYLVNGVWLDFYDVPEEQSKLPDVIAVSNEIWDFKETTYTRSSPPIMSNGTVVKKDGVIYLDVSPINTANGLTRSLQVSSDNTTMTVTVRYDYDKSSGMKSTAKKDRFILKRQ